ncbi:MAG: glycosyltransferase family 4 protein [Planctomycetota bacterium]|nr:glycosyltransferase family 4 protein [Planctomycetota bacterium]
MQESRKIRILWLTDNEFDTQRYTSRLVEVITHLQKSCDVQLVTGYARRKVQPAEFHNKIIYYDMAKLPYAKAVTRYLAQCRVFGAMVKSFRPDVVIFNVLNPILMRYAAALRRKHDIKVICDVRTFAVSHSVCRNRVFDGLLASCLRYTAKHLDGITYITDEMRRYCIEKYKLHEHPSAIWTSGVNPKLFSPSKAASNSRGLTILYHGTISRRRNIESIINALSLIKDIDVHLALLGDGDGLQRLMQLVGRLGLDTQVSFEKPVDYKEVPDWINTCDVGILPFDDWDGWNVCSPIKLFEYLACGKPVIVTNITAHRNVLQDSPFAFWANQGSPEDIAEAIRHVYNRRKSLEHLGSESRKLILADHTWARQADKLKLFCDSVLENQRT